VHRIDTVYTVLLENDLFYFYTTIPVGAPDQVFSFNTTQMWNEILQQDIGLLNFYY